jgi:ethanolamine kinase
MTPEYSDKVLIHGDVNHGNVIHNKELETLTLVDYEFSGYGERYVGLFLGFFNKRVLLPFHVNIFRLFDLANHFCEWSGLDLNWSLCPSLSQQVKFLSTYARVAFERDDISGCEVSHHGTEKEAMADSLR